MPTPSRCARRNGCTNPDSIEPCLVCPFTFACPECQAGPGSPCKRPSWHRCSAHIGRVNLADRQAVREQRPAVVTRYGESFAAYWEAQLAPPFKA